MSDKENIFEIVNNMRKGSASRASFKYLGEEILFKLGWQNTMFNL